MAQETRTSRDASLPERPNRIGLAPVATLGILIFGLFFGGLGFWAGQAELASAALAPGRVAPEGQRKTVQHFEGGIVDTIHVQEGDHVEKGELLVTLDDTSVRAHVERITVALYNQLALRARLIAERDKMDALAIPPELEVASDHPSIGPVIESQTSVFNARRAAYAGKVEILDQQIAQRHEEIVGLEGEIEAADIQISFLDSEIEDVTRLLKKGLVERPRVNALKRQRAAIGGERAKARAGIARARQAIGEARVRMAELETRMIGESVEKLQDVEARILDFREQLAAARNVLERTEIRAPRAGRVVGLQVHTRGGVIGAGEPILDIVPREARLLVDARIDPGDIDVVVPGQTAEIRLSAYQQRHFKPLQGRLLSISADALTDPDRDVSYYLGRIEITEPIENAIPGARLYPGMQAETVILTGSSTVLDWILRPLERSFERGLREE